MQCRRNECIEGPCRCKRATWADRPPGCDETVTDDICDRDCSVMSQPPPECCPLRRPPEPNCEPKERLKCWDAPEWRAKWVQAPKCKVDLYKFRKTFEIPPGEKVTTNNNEDFKTTWDMCNSCCTSPEPRTPGQGP